MKRNRIIINTEIDEIKVKDHNERESLCKDLKRESFQINYHKLNKILKKDQKPWHF